MGTTVKRYWDWNDRSSREARPGDPAAETFDAFVPHLVARWEPVLGPGVWRQIADAEAALAALAADEGAACAAWLLSRAESAASSIIERIRPTGRGLAGAEFGLGVGDEPTESDVETLRNGLATDHAVAIGSAGSEVTVGDICDVHRTLMGDTPIAGQLRDRQNWIGAPWSTPLDAVVVPPPPEMVPRWMEDLVTCINRDTPVALLDVALVHAQFEAIHPFADGNGRAGRALIQLMLRRSGLTLACVPPVSLSLAVRRDFYIMGLNQTRAVCPPDSLERSDAHSEWIALLADATEDASLVAQRVIAHVGAIQADWQHRISSLGARPSSAAARLAASLTSNPVINVQTAAELLGANLRTTHRALNVLAEAGIIMQSSAGSRNRVYEAEAITDLLSTLVSLKVPDPLPTATPPQPRRADPDP